MTEATTNPLSGLWKPIHLEKLYYGPDSVRKHLIDSLPTTQSKAFIITGSSLAIKTPLIQQVEQLLTSAHHAGTFSNIKQHAPVAQLDEATQAVQQDASIDTIISIGGGSPIDSAKAISHRLSSKHQKPLYHIAIPTTLSAAECTFTAGYTNSTGTKIGISHPSLAPRAILYDAIFALHTPPHLWTSTGIRALDHAIEQLYHPTATEISKQMCLSAIASLFTYLPRYAADPKNEDTITHLQLAAFASLGLLGCNLKGGLGLSHALGYAIGSPYDVPHGVTSCLTLGHVVKLKAEAEAEAAQIARVLPVLGRERSGHDAVDARRVGDEVLGLVRELGLGTSLGELGVGRGEAEVIAKRVAGGREGDEFERVLGLVKGLY
ncbi:Dehydroquinate synthase-like protein [Patellaria atrata CBS 101060]|uniref:Dehydroquinate synthase-like protein n=1 Tax=Patellaria atrata CBS 101060 TaxID=1346257 RepID=A0A9P4S6I7_9PEZI|nr:Dehydroquinate synthase-like protein [Patellaria atrata CBS 101060]